MNNMADEMADSGQWSTVQNKGKRKRINTGSVNFESYETMTPDEKLNVLFNKMINIEKGQESSILKITDLQGEIQNVNSQIDTHNTHLKALSYKVIDLETKIRRKNVIIYGLEERYTGRDAIYDDLNDFFNQKMCIDYDDLCIESAERLGTLNNYRNNNTAKKRTIIVTFRYPHNVDTVMRNARILAGTKYAVDRDYPPEVRIARKKLWPAYKEYRKNRSNRVQLKYPAALIVNDRVMIDEFPCWDEIMSTNTKTLTGKDQFITTQPTLSSLLHSKDNNINSQTHADGCSPVNDAKFKK
jgi:hypothetical protein